MSWPGENSDLSETGVALTQITLASMIVMFLRGSAAFLGSPMCFCGEMGTGYHHLAEFGLQAWPPFCCLPVGVPALTLNSGGSSFLPPPLSARIVPNVEQCWGNPWGQAGGLGLPLAQVTQEAEQGLLPFALTRNPLRPESSRSVHWGRDLHPIGLRPLFQRQVVQIPYVLLCSLPHLRRCCSGILALSLPSFLGSLAI